MHGILYHLTCMKPCKSWNNKCHINWHVPDFFHAKKASPTWRTIPDSKQPETQTWMELIYITTRALFLLWAQEAPAVCKGLIKCGKMALVSLLRQFDRSLFDFVAVFLLQQFLIEVTSKFWDSSVSPYPWKRQAKKWRHCWSWSINLLGILPGSWACSQRPSANKRSKMPDVCANLRACRQLAGQCFRSWNTKTYAASSPHSVVAGLCPLMLTSSWTKKARNPQKRELVPSSTFYSLWLLPFPKLSESHWEFPSWTPQQALFSLGKALGQCLRGIDPHGT